jgi:hypothetical protein
LKLIPAHFFFLSLVLLRPKSLGLLSQLPFFFLSDLLPSFDNLRLNLSIPLFELLSFSFLLGKSFLKLLNHSLLLASLPPHLLNVGFYCF